MNRRIISVIFVALFTIVSPPDCIKGQSTDSLLYLIDNNLVEDDSEKYDLLNRVLRALRDTERKIQYSDQAIELAQRLDILPALPYLSKGEAYLFSGRYDKALECFFQSAQYYEESGQTAGLGLVYNAMAETYSKQGNSDNEKHYIELAIDVFKQVKDSLRLGYAYHNLGYFNYDIGQYDTALVYFNETLDLLKALNKPYAVRDYFVCLGNAGLAYSKLSDFDRAEENLLTAIDTLISLGHEYAVPEFIIEYASILRQEGEINQAITYASMAFNITDDPDYKRDASQLLARLYAISGRYDSAYYYQDIFIVTNDSIKDLESVQEMADLRYQYDMGKMQDELDIMKKKKLITTLIIIGLAIILILAIGLVTTYYNNLKRSRELTRALEERRILLVNQSAELKEKNEKILRSNEELTGLNEAISKQNEQILEANEELTVLNEAISKQKNEILDSITYAKRIQSALMPPEQYFHEILNDVFILFKPRDIVSGDFYWIKQVNNYVVLAAADCTGHGVPGAFMSMLGMSYLNEIIQRREITQANQVLNELRKQIRNSLRQHGDPEESKDGIDMALCVIDEKQKLLQYSGANNPMYFIRDQNGTPELTEFKPDRMPLGYYQGRFKAFKNHDIQLEYGDVIYLFSDGFMDQKGGKDGKKFLSKNFKKLLLEIHEEPMHDQKQILNKTIEEWMGDHPQIDDILVMGVRV